EMARARGFLEELLVQAKKEPDTLKARIAYAVLAGGDPEALKDAVERLEKHIAKEPRDEDALMVLGEEAQRRGDWKRAQGMYEKAMALRPGARAVHALAMLSVAQRDPKAAQPLLEK